MNKENSLLNRKLAFNNVNVTGKLFSEEDNKFYLKLPLSKTMEQKLNPKNYYIFYSLLEISIVENRETSNIWPLFIRMSFCRDYNQKALFEESSFYNKEIHFKAVENSNNYFFNVVSGEFYLKEKNGFADVIIDEIINTIYIEHLNKQNIEVFNENICKAKFKKVIFFITKNCALFLCLVNSILTGNKIILADSIFNNKLRFNEQILEETEIQQKKITFYGINIHLIPITAYSLINLIGYTIFKTFGIKNNLLSSILQNVFLSTIYVIATLFIYQCIISYIVKIFIKLLNYIANRSKKKMFRENT